MDRHKLGQALAALGNNDLERLQALRETEGSLGFLSDEGNNLLHLAIIKKSEIKIFEYLLTLPEIDKERLNVEGHSPLLYAFLYERDNPEYATKLIESDCNIDCQDSNENTPLHLAVYNQWIDVMDLLIARGADTEICNYGDETPLLVAAPRRPTPIDSIPNQMIWLLLSYGADPYVTNLRYEDDLMRDAYLNFFDIIYLHQDFRFFDQFKDFHKFFNLCVIVKMMRFRPQFFQELILLSDCYIDYGPEDLYYFLRSLFSLNCEALKLFIEMYGFVLEDAFAQYPRGFEILHRMIYTCRSSEVLSNFCDYLYILLESSAVDAVVNLLNSINQYHLMATLIECFKRQSCSEEPTEEPLEKFLNRCLSYGVQLTSTGMSTLHYRFGYKSLFKSMLLKPIIGIEENFNPRTAWPTVIFNIHMNLNDLYNYPNYTPSMKNILWEHFSLSVLRHLRFPTLQELSRNATRERIKTKFQIENHQQFYAKLNQLHMAETHRKMISFELVMFP